MQPRRVVLLISLLLLGIVPAWAATPVGLHTSLEELACWRQRAGIDAQGATTITTGVTCPVKYKTAGDVSTNSPGNWDDIVANTTTFASNPAADHWVGQTTNACVVNQWITPIPGTDPDDTVTLGTTLLHAAFYGLVANDSTVRAQVRTELLSLAAEAGLDFSNGSRWCKAGETNDGNPFFMIAIWGTRMLFAYDYLRVADTVYGTTVLSAGNRTTLDTWFQGMGTYWVWMGACGSPQSSGDEFYVDRSGENYTTQNIPTGSEGILYFGGPTVQQFHAKYNNRRGAEVTLLGHLGLTYANATWTRCTKRWWKEWLRYGIWADGSGQDLERWGDGANLQHLGWSYSSGVIHQMSALADIYGRTGDMSLFEYSTSEGVNGTDGGPKTLQLTVEALVNYADHTFARYATTNGGDVGNANYLLDFRSELGAEHVVSDTWFALANLYIAQADPTAAAHIRTVYLRTATDQFAGGTIPAYPAVPTANTYAWGGSAGAWPAIPLMWGQLDLEPDANPYADAAENVLAPLRLRLLR